MAAWSISHSARTSRRFSKGVAAAARGSITLTLTYEPHGPENTEIFVSAKWTKKIPVDAGLNDKSIYLLNNNNDLVKDIAQNQPQLRGVGGGDDRADGSSPGEQRGYG